MKINLFKSLHAVILLCLSCTQLRAIEIDDKYRYPNFVEVAKKAIPAVVSIQVRSSSKPFGDSKHDSGDFDQGDPFGFFGDDFFHHFFGKPSKRNGNIYQQPKVGQGSGFIITPDGYVLTNSHVVRDADEIIVTLNNGRELAGKVVGEDPNTDVAVLKIEANDLPHLTLGNSDNLDVGQWVMTIGNPLGLQASATVGIVSAKGRNNLQLARIEDFIQTDAAINKGNSGGPLLNLNGDVVGINTAIVSNNGSGYMGIGFAIPSNMAEYVMQELIKTGSVSRGYVGIVMQAIDHDLANAFNLEKVHGALVTEVASDSPAQKAGVKQGDIITKINGKHVENIASLRNTISLMKPGTIVELTVVREGNPSKVSMEIGKFPETTAVIASSNNKLGFDVENLTVELARKFGYDKDKGVMISKVESGSPADWAGLKKGAIIEAVNQKPVTSVEEFQQELNAIGPGKPILMLIKQGDIRRFVSIKVS